MRICLDTNALIDLIEHSCPCGLDDFEKQLRAGGHRLLFSVFNVLELSAPLVHPNPKTNVMRLLSHLENLPIEYISGARILIFELREALTAFQQKREYEAVSPYADRFDSALSVWGDSPTALFINHSLPETVFTLWNETPDLFKQPQNYLKALQNLFESDRSLEKKPNLSNHFIETTARNLRRAKLSVASEDIGPFAKWIYDDNTRCPGLRLGYEIHHRLLKNIGDQVQKGDIPDFEHIECIPYADIVTIENRMRSYINQACHKDAFPYGYRVYKDLKEVLAVL